MFKKKKIFCASYSAKNVEEEEEDEENPRETFGVPLDKAKVFTYRRGGGQTQSLH